jgi:GH25 family lysozyme M1 (1,4-beta-N-acetylmuramidase)
LREVVVRRLLPTTVLAAAVLVALPQEHGVAAGGHVRGMDVSSHQGAVNWKAAYAHGARFAYVKATEGTGYRNPYFTQQYEGSYKVGMIHGAYHFARPELASGKAQADYFVDHGGGWSADGRTLPPALDLEWNPYGGDACYGVGRSAMVSWIKAFAKEVYRRAHRHPVFYTSTSWWQLCTGGYPGFGKTDPLWVARWSSKVGPLPAGWKHWRIWQYNDDHGSLPGDQDRFSGGWNALKAFAKGYKR